MSTAGRWIDPTSALPLRFGTHALRLRVALALLFAGGILLQLTSAYTLLIAIAGLAASVAGWCLVPAPGWRRTVAAVPAVLGVVSLLGGASAGALTALTLAAWLLVRARPAASYLVLALPVAASILLAQLFRQYGAGAVVATVMGAVIVTSAWLGWSIAVGVERRAAAKRRMPSH